MKDYLKQNTSQAPQSSKPNSPESSPRKCQRYGEFFDLGGKKLKWSCLMYINHININSLLLNFRSDWRPALLSALEMRKLWTYLYTCWTWPPFGKPQATWLICKLHSGHGASASLNLEYQTNQQDMACLAPPAVQTPQFSLWVLLQSNLSSTGPGGGKKVANF